MFWSWSMAKMLWVRRFMSEKEFLGRERKFSIEREVKKWKPNHASSIYRKTWLDGSRSYRYLSSTKPRQKWIYQGDVEDLLMGKVPRCIEKLSRIYRLNRKFLDGSRSYQYKFRKARWTEITLVYPRERERERKHITNRTKRKKEYVCMKHAWTCDVLKIK